MKPILGTVTSSKMTKTVVVSVERRWRHPLYKKIVKRSKKYLAHDELGVKVGETVYIQETRPLSKKKKWKIVQKVDNKSQKSQRKTKRK